MNWLNKNLHLKAAGRSLQQLYIFDNLTGTAIPDLSGNNRTGYYGGMTLGANVSNIGSSAIQSDGVNDYCSIISTDAGSTTNNLVFNTTNMSITLFMKAVNAGVWTNGVTTWFLNILTTANTDSFALEKRTTNNSVRFRMDANSNTDNYDYTTSTTDLFSMGITYQYTGGTRTLKFYFNGILVNSPGTDSDQVLNTTIRTNRGCIGNYGTDQTVSPLFNYYGWAFYHSTLTPEEMYFIGNPQ